MDLMYKSILFLPWTLFLLISCSTYPNNERNVDTSSARISLRAAEMTDSLIKEVEKGVSKKTLDDLYKGQDSCPLKITKYFLTYNSINSPEANITYKNVSTKLIDGIKVSVACYNNFDEPVTSGYSNVFGGIDQDKLRPGRQKTGTWTMSLFDNTTKIKPFIREVHFSDGTTWKAIQ